MKILFLYSRPLPSGVPAGWDIVSWSEAAAKGELSYCAALSHFPILQTSISLHIALILNGYLPDNNELEDRTEKWKGYDIIVIRWGDWMQIAWTLVAIWSLRCQHAGNKVIIWGRWAQNGEDRSSELRCFEGNSMLALLFDAMICSSSIQDLNNLLVYFRGESTAILRNVLLNRGNTLEWHGESDYALGFERNVSGGSDSKRRLNPPVVEIMD